MEPIHIFVWKEDGVTQAITEDAASRQMVLENPEKPNGKIVAMSTFVSRAGTNTIISSARYSDGRWHTVNLKPEILRGDNLKAEQSLNVVNEAGMYIYQVHRQQDAFAAQVIESWDFPDPYSKDGKAILPVDEESLGKIPNKVADLLVNLIWVRFKGSPKTFRFPG